MPLLVNSVPNLAQGVSQQPDNLRYPGQCDEQINAWATVVEGLKKRPNTNYVKNLDSTSTSSNIFTHFVKRDETNQYIISVSVGNVSATIISLSNTGATTARNVPVSISSTASKYLSLGTSVTNPLEDLRALTVADYTFLVNKKRVVRSDKSIQSPIPPTEALIAVKLGDYEKAYSIYIDGTLVSPASSLTNVHKYTNSYWQNHPGTVVPTTYFSGPSNGGARSGIYADTEHIAEDLKICIEEEHGTSRTGIADISIAPGGGGSGWLDTDRNMFVWLPYKTKKWFNAKQRKTKYYIKERVPSKLAFVVKQTVGGVENTSAFGVCRVVGGVIQEFIFTNRGSGYDTDTSGSQALELELTQLVNGLFIKHVSPFKIAQAKGWQKAQNEPGSEPTAPTLSSSLTTQTLSPINVERDGSLIRIKKSLIVSNGGFYYKLQDPHLSTSDNEPGSGTNWQQYWTTTTSSVGAIAWQSDYSYDFDDDLTVRTTDGLQNQGLTAIYKEINSITDLPASCYSGFTVKVRGDADIAQDDYYVTFETSDGEAFGEGSWVETVGWRNDKSNTALLTGVDIELDQTTMPITLKPVLKGKKIVSFKLQSPQEDEFVEAPYELGWRQRKAGDDFTNPMPSFVSTDGSYVSLGGSIYTCIRDHVSAAAYQPNTTGGENYWNTVTANVPEIVDAWVAGEKYNREVTKTINDVFFFKNRLGFVTDTSVIFSEADEYFNFFRTTTQQLLDSAPIDVGISHTKTAILQHAIPFQEKLMLFSKQSQFVLRGADVLSPKTVAISPVTEYDISDSVEPVALGNYIYFTFKRNDFEGLYEYFVDNNTEVFDAEEVTQQVPKYIPKDVRKIAGSQAENTLVVSTSEDLKTLYVYKYFWSNKEKIQSAWMKFSFDRDIVGFDFIDSKLFMITKDTGGLHLEFLTLEDGLTDEGLDYPLLLDSRVDGSELKVSYSASTKKSTISNFPYDPADVEVYSKIGHKYDFTKTTSTAGEVTGDITSVPFFAGVPYTMTYRFSDQSLKQPTERGGRSASDYTFQTIRNGSINYADTGHFVVEVTPKYRDTYKYVFNPDIVGANLLLNDFEPQNGHFRFAVQGQPGEVTIEVKSDSALPCKLLAAEFESMFIPRSRRYGS